VSEITTETAVPIVEAALERLGIEATPRRVWAVLTTARAETGYGTGWYSPPHGPEAPTSKNWGAVQDVSDAGSFQYLDLAKADRPTEAAPPSTDPSRYFYALDYNPFHTRSDGGKGSWFWGPYRVYPTDVDGARDVARLLDKKGALDAAEKEGSTEAIARASYGYYTGMSSDKEKQIALRAEQLWRMSQAIAERLGVEPVLTLSGKPQPAPPQDSNPGAVVPESCSPSVLPSLRIGSHSGAVKLWQRLLNADPNRRIILNVDGVFGPITLATTRHWQSRRSIRVDGIVGPISWSRMP
jgi:peptidoglycan hydrolase-like protein with peptidoglycan-binding domain